MLLEKELLEKSEVMFGFWSCQRPFTKHWGSGNQFWDRFVKNFGEPDIVFGKQDTIPKNIITVDNDKKVKPTYCLNWNKLPFKKNQFKFGYWDPPYDHLYKKETIEISRVCKKLAILHTYIYPTSWLGGGDFKRIGMIAITFGPMKQIRILQIFERKK